jgi:tetratricopeptide (TPR) repeat protein
MGSFPLLLIPLIVPVIYSKITQDSFLFPKELFFMAAAAFIYFYRSLKLYTDKTPRTLYFSALDLLALILLLICAVSIAARDDFYPALHPFITVIAAAVFYCELKFFNRLNLIMNVFTDCFIFSGLIGVLYAFLQYYRLDFIFGGAAPADKMRLFSFFGNKNYFSEFITAVIFLIAAKIIILSLYGRRGRLIKNRGRALAFYYIALVLYFSMIFIIQSRASFLALAAGGLYSIIMIWRNERLRSFLILNRRLFAGGLAALIIAAAVFSTATPLTHDKTDIIQRLSSIFDFTAERNIAIRFDIWHATVKMIKDNFWTGCGLGYFKMNFLDYQSLLFKENSNLFYENQFFAKANQAHNELLQIFCELGIFGFLCALMFISALIYGSHKALASYKSPAAARRYTAVTFVSASLISVFINSLFAFPLHILPTALFFITCAVLSDRLAFSRAAGRYKYLFTARYSLEPFKLNAIIVTVAGTIVLLMLAAAAPAYITANINMKAGLDCLKLDLTHKAGAYLKKSIEANPYNGETRYYMGIYHMQNKEYDAAVIEFMRSLQSESDPNIFSNIGLAFYKIGMYDHAAGYMKKALDIAPHNLYYLLNSGCIYQKKHDYAAAVEYFQKALTYASTPEATVNLGHAYYLMGMHDKAAAALSEALLRYGALPRYAERIYYLLGLSYMDSKNYKSAGLNLKNARALNPGNPDYALNLGLTLIFEGKTAEAEILFGDYLKKDFNALIAYNLAGLYYGERRFFDALIILNKLKGDAEEKSGAVEVENNRLYRRTIDLINAINYQKNSKQ